MSAIPLLRSGPDSPYSRELIDGLCLVENVKKQTNALVSAVLYHIAEMNSSPGSNQFERLGEVFRNFGNVCVDVFVKNVFEDTKQKFEEAGQILRYFAARIEGDTVVTLQYWSTSKYEFIREEVKQMEKLRVSMDAAVLKVGKDCKTKSKHVEDCDLKVAAFRAQHSRVEELLKDFYSENLGTHINILQSFLDQHNFFYEEIIIKLQEVVDLVFLP